MKQRRLQSNREGLLNHHRRSGEQ